MASLDTFQKQPADVQDYDVDFTEWLAALGDTGASAVAVADAGITLQVYSHTAGVVKVWLSGGTTGMTYKVTTTLTTTGGRVKQAEFRVKVRET